MVKIILCIYGEPRQSMPTLAGRSGKQYSRAIFNPKEQRHETQPFDIEYFNTKMLPDLAKLTGFGLKSWLPIVVEQEEKQEEKSQTTLEKDAFSTLTGAETNNAPDGSLVELKKDDEALTGDTAKSADEFAAMNFRDLRALARSKGLKVTNATKKDEILTMLRAPAAPVTA